MATVTRTCPLCEAMCGLLLDIGRGDPAQGAGGDPAVRRVRGDRDDVYSQGFLCPKGASLAKIDADPDRLQGPLVRRNGELTACSWDEAFAEVDRLLTPIIADSGRDAVGVFLGNAIGHNPAVTLYVPTLLRALATTQVYSSATLDNMPHNVVAALLLGHQGSIPVPDVDRTDLLVVVGGNPVVSNGSVGAAPDYPGRLRRLRERGGRLVVVDPARTATAALADRHLAPRPGTDALLLLAAVRTLFDEDMVDLGHLAPLVARDAVDEVGEAVAPFSAEAVGPRCGIDSVVIRDLAREVAAARRAAVYGRLGTTLNPFGTLASWGLVLLNVLTGHLDRPGGMMFPEPPAGSPTTRRQRGAPAPVRFGAHRSRVRGAPEVFGELPAACIAEEILTPGDRRVRGFVVVGGNPARSVPGSAAMEEALAVLDALVCVDPYLNETTRFADVVLPPPGVLTRSHGDILLPNYAVRNVAKYSAPALPLPAGAMKEWRILLRLAGVLAGRGPGADADVDRVDADVRARLVASAARECDLPPEQVAATVGSATGPDALLDLRLRSGPFGDLFGARPGGLTLERLRAAPHGIDLGPLRPRIAEVVRTPSGLIDLAPSLLLADVARLEAELRAEVPDLVLVGRRHLRSKNSWLHNIPVLVKGRPRCTLQVHPADAARHGLHDGGAVRVTSADGSVVATAEITDAVAPGVCSLPHGWGHGPTGTRTRVAAQHAGVNSNLLAGTERLDPLSGTAVLNGIPVALTALPALPALTAPATQKESEHA